MRAHIVEGGEVVNSVEVPDLNWEVGPGQTLIDGEIGGIGWKVVDGALVPPAQQEVPVTAVPAVALLERLTVTEYASIRNSSNSEVQRFLDSLIARQVVDFTDDSTKAGLKLWASEGVITVTRLAEIQRA